MCACLRLFLMLALVLPGGAALAQNLVSGGATLPAPLYQDAMADLPGGALPGCAPSCSMTRVPSIEPARFTGQAASCR